MKTLIVRLISDDTASNEIIKYFYDYNKEIEEKFKNFKWFVIGRADYRKLVRETNDLFQITNYFGIVKQIDDEAVKILENLKNDGTFIVDEKAIENIKANIGKLGFLDYLENI